MRLVEEDKKKGGLTWESCMTNYVCIKKIKNSVERIDIEG
jgi:hypothetical protein